jgi:hypothetical protein
VPTLSYYYENDKLEFEIKSEELINELNKLVQKELINSISRLDLTPSQD